MSGGAASAIRRARPDDLDRVVDHWIALGDHHAALGPQFALRADARPEIRRLLAAQLRDPDVAAWLYEDAVAGEGVVGLCIARIDRAPPIARERIRAEITDLGVAPAQRRRGIGRALVDRALAWIRERRVERVEVRVAVGNPEGQAFWRALGFGASMDVLERRL